MPSRSTPDLVGILEAAYAVERSERDWLTGLMDALKPSIESGLGIAGYLYDTNDRPFRVKHLLVDGCPVDEGGIAMLNDEGHDAFVRSSWIARSAMMASETPGYATHPGVLEVFHPAGIRDVMVINALDPVGIGCWIGAPLDREGTLDGPAREQWNRVAAHVRSALRLRLRLAAREKMEATSLGEPEAIVATSGKVQHLEPSAESEREALRAAALGILRAKRELRDGPDLTLSSWQALVRARWTFVDEFHRDGSRYLVARVNPMATRPTARLSERERQVVACLSMGQTNKEVAYELGLAHSTVRVLVARASAKLGVATRAELIAKYREDVVG